jgi:hypothetical protein
LHPTFPKKFSPKKIQPVTARACASFVIREQLKDLKESAKLLIEDELQELQASR